MNEVVNKFLLAGDKFMPEMHLHTRTVTQSIYKEQRKDSKIYRNIRYASYLSKRSKQSRFSA